MRHILLVFVLFCSLKSFSQDKFAIGGLIGSTYYIGEYNPNGIPFFRPFVYGGGIVNYSFNEFYDLKMNMSAGKLQGISTPYYYDNQPGFFDKLIVDFSLSLMVGFMPYDPFGNKTGKENVQPYFTLGVGGIWLDNEMGVKIPMGLGVKYRLAPRWTVGAEWVFNKTFTDNIDNVTGATNVAMKRLYQTDWYSVLGISLTYQLKSNCDCPGSVGESTYQKRTLNKSQSPKDKY